MDLTKSFEDKEFIHWAIIASVTGCKVTDKMSATPFDITMQINGEEVNPLNILTRMEEQYDYQVAKEAKSILKSATYDLTESIQEMVNDFETSLSRKIDEEMSKITLTQQPKE